MIKISVVVPVWNVEEYIEKCLNSIVNQTLKDIEIIVVNDGSPDNSQKIIDKFVKEHPKKIKSYIKANGGQGSARNYGLKKSKGEYIAFVDSDDWIDSTMLEEMYETASLENSDIVICDMIEHYPNKDIYHDCTNLTYKFDKAPSVCNRLFKKSLINNVEFISGIWYEDLNFTTKILMSTDKISTISKSFYHYYYRPNSTMNNNNSVKNLDIIASVNDIINYAKKNNFYDNNKSELEFLIINHILVTSIMRVAKHNSKDKNSVIKRMIEYCHQNIPDFDDNIYYKNWSINKKIVAKLNYYSFWKLSLFIVRLKTKVFNK